MSETFVTVERGDDSVALIRLDRPKVNALSGELLGQMADIAQDLIDNPPGAVVVWGGEKVFAAGADISQFGDTEMGKLAGDNFGRALGNLSKIPRMVIAAINGVALGGGCELAMACDYRIAGEKSRFGQPEVLLGIIPGAGGTQRLPRLVGSSRAKELCLTGRQVMSDEALRIGLCDEVVPDDQVLARARELAAKLAKGALLSQGVQKELIDRGLDGTLEEGLAAEKAAFASIFATEDAQIGIRSFMEQGPGKAQFTGR